MCRSMSSWRRPRPRFPILRPGGWASPRAARATRRNGPDAANEAARSCDVLLALGTRFDDRPTSSWIPGMTYSIPPTRLIHVDIDVAEIGRNYPAEVGIVGDIELVLRQLLGAMEGREAESRERHAAWTDRLADTKRRWADFLH